ncbi:hypothetical protein BBK36DRAFT_1129993, partial [Trichoderma citrinoviride]
KRKKEQKIKTYNSRCSLVVTHPTTNLPVSGLSMGERTGPRVFHYLWSYVLGTLLHQLICDMDFMMSHSTNHSASRPAPSRWHRQSFFPSTSRHRQPCPGFCSSLFHIRHRKGR